MKIFKYILLTSLIYTLSSCTAVYKIEHIEDNQKTTSYGILGGVTETRIMPFLSLYSEKVYIDPENDETLKKEK